MQNINVKVFGRTLLSFTLPGDVSSPGVCTAYSINSQTITLVLQKMVEKWEENVRPLDYLSRDMTKPTK